MSKNNLSVNEFYIKKCFSLAKIQLENFSYSDAIAMFVKKQKMGFMCVSNRYLT